MIKGILLIFINCLLIVGFGDVGLTRETPDGEEIKGVAADAWPVDGRP
jgi:hypothetical protein